jgi:hypothetical protein
LKSRKRSRQAAATMIAFGSVKSGSKEPPGVVR